MTLLALPAVLRQIILKYVALGEAPFQVRRHYNGVQAQPHVLRAGMLVANQQLYHEYLEATAELVLRSKDVSFEALVVNMSCIDISGLIYFTNRWSRMAGSHTHAMLQLHVRLVMTHTDRIESHSLDRWLNHCRKTGLKATYTFECSVEDPQQTEHDYTVADIRSEDDHELVKIYTAILEWSVKQCNLMAEQAQQTFEERSSRFQAMVRMGSQQTAASLIRDQRTILVQLRKETGKARRKIKVYETAAKEATASLDEAKRLSGIWAQHRERDSCGSGTGNSISTLCL